MKVWSLVWWGALLLVASACIGLQLDRQARRDPALAAMVPPPFRNFSQVHIALETIERNDARRALAESRLLLARSPVPAENLSALALAAAGAQDAPLAERTLLAAAGRGWRDPLAQYFVADAAMRAGETGQASMRLLSRWLLGARDAAFAGQFRRSLQSQEEIDAVAEWMANTTRQTENFAGWSIENLDDETSSRLIEATANKGGAISCASHRRFSDRYLRLGYAHAAQRVWPDACEQSDYSRFSARENILADWSAVRGGRFLADNVLAYENTSPGYAKIGETLSTLAAGDYRVNYEGSLARGEQGAVARLDVFCIERGGSQRMLEAVKLHGQDILVAIPHEGCGVQNFKLLAPYGRGEIRNLRILPRLRDRT